jgi:hypothetical protein
MRLGYLTIALSMTAATVVGAQTSADASARSTAIAASFSKFKSLSKEKHGIKKEKYLRVRSEPAVKNPAEYSGNYVMKDYDLGLELQVNADGTFSGRGYEPLNENVKRTFTLRNGRVTGALARATKVYANGSSEPFEGAFMNRSVYESPTDKGVTIFGFGTLGHSVVIDGQTIDKFFYEKTR